MRRNQPIYFVFMAIFYTFIQVQTSDAFAPNRLVNVDHGKPASKRFFSTQISPSQSRSIPIFKTRKIRNDDFLKRTRPGTVNHIFQDLTALEDEALVGSMINDEMDQAVLLAQDIIGELRDILDDVKSTENKLRHKQSFLVNTIQEALDPSDPGRLLRLS